MLAQLGDIAQPLPAIGTKTTCSETYDMFAGNDDLMTLVVTNEERPVGLVNRNEFLIRMAQLYGRALYDKKPIVLLMDESPLIVDVAIDLDLLNQRILVDKPGALLKGFIITEDGRYLGVGNAHAVLQMNVDLLAAKTSSLEIAKQAMLESSLAKSRFLANISHELRTPLNSVIGFSQMISEERHGSLQNPQYREFAEHIHESGQHLLELVNTVLDFTRIESGRLELMEADVDVEDLIQACVAMVKVRAEQAGIEIVVEVEAGVDCHRLDELRTRQALLNLLSNAIKFTDQGGRVTISVDLTQEGELVFSIRDTGIGMSAEEVERALEPFVQVENDLNRRYDGSGLGLPLARSIVHLQGGTFDIESLPGQGTCVCFKFPVGDRQGEARSSERACA